jgi:hypothetical protein
VRRDGSAATLVQAAAAAARREALEGEMDALECAGVPDADPRVRALMAAWESLSAAAPWEHSAAARHPAGAGGVAAGLGLRERALPRTASGRLVSDSGFIKVRSTGPAQIARPCVPQMRIPALGPRF